MTLLSEFIEAINAAECEEDPEPIYISDRFFREMANGLTVPQVCKMFGLTCKRQNFHQRQSYLGFSPKKEETIILEDDKL